MSDWYAIQLFAKRAGETARQREAVGLPPVTREDVRRNAIAALSKPNPLLAWARGQGEVKA